jgi:hypothetical protein
VVTWADVAENHPDLATLTERVFAARRLKVLATLRADGMPRLSEVSGAFIREGELWLKRRDLDRDPRCSVHSGSPADAAGASARVSGRAVAADAGAATRLGMIAEGETRPDPEKREILIEWWSETMGPGRQVRPGG